MTAFFIPGLLDARGSSEDAYVEMRNLVEVDTGLRPCERRVQQIRSRRGGADCVTEVGRPDPLHGGTVMAIFDLGPHRPFVVHREPAAGSPDPVHEVLSCHAYSVIEFDR